MVSHLLQILLNYPCKSLKRLCHKALSASFFFILFLSFDSYAGSIELSNEEKVWLKEHPVIRVANELDWAPFDFNRYGEPKGLAIDFIKLVSERAGLEIKFVYGCSWGELIKRFKERKIDVMPVFYKNKERMAYTLFTTPYHGGKLGVFTHLDNLVKNLDFSKVRTGMETGHGSIPLVRKKVPGINIIEVDYKESLVHKLATKELDAVIANPFVVYYHAKENQIDTIRLTDFINLDDEQQRQTSFHVGVRKDWPHLYSIIQKSIDSISDEEMNKVKNKWTDISIVEPVNWRFIIQIAALVVCVFLFLLWNNRRLNALVDEKTKELKELNENLELKVKDRTFELKEANIRLQESIDHIKTLHGIIPICSSCKKIRDDKGLWNMLETYISKHSMAEFSHGICPDCLKELYPNMVEEGEKK